MIKYLFSIIYAIKLLDWEIKMVLSAFKKLSNKKMI